MPLTETAMLSTETLDMRDYCKVTSKLLVGLLSGFQMFSTSLELTKEKAKAIKKVDGNMYLKLSMNLIVLYKTSYQLAPVSHKEGKTCNCDQIMDSRSKRQRPL